MVNKILKEHIANLQNNTLEQEDHEDLITYLKNVDEFEAFLEKEFMRLRDIIDKHNKEGRIEEAVLWNAKSHFREVSRDVFRL